MAAMRDVFMVVAALLVAAGSGAIVVLEFGSSGRRLVSRARDTLEVALPPVLIILLTWFVWVNRP